MRIAIVVTAITAAVILGGCVTTAPERKLIPVVMPDGERATIGAYNRQIPDWMYADEAFRLDFLVRGEANEKQLAALAAAEGACRVFTDTVHPSRLTAVLINGGLYLAAGALGAGLGAKGFLNPRALVDSNYYGYGGTAGAFNGLASGIASGGGRSYTFQNCGREVVSLFPGYQVRVLNKSPY